MTNPRPIRRLAVLKSEPSPAQPRRRHGVDCAACPNAQRCALRLAIARRQTSASPGPKAA